MKTTTKSWFARLVTEQIEEGAMKELIELIVGRSNSEHTQRQYRSILKALCAFQNCDFEGLRNLTRPEAMRFIRDQRNRKGQKGRKLGQDEKVCESTVHRKHLILKSIFKELVEMGVLEKNPFDFPMVVPPQEPQKRPTKALPLHMVEKLINAPDAFTPKGIQDRALLAVLLGNGGRRGEIGQIIIGNVKRHQNGAVSYEVLKSKGGKTLTKYLPQWASERLLRLIEYRQHQGAGANDFVFVGVQGEPLSGCTVRYRFKKWIEKIGLDPKEYSPHSSRATVVTMLRTEGYDDRQIMSVTGHSSRQSLERYDKREFAEREHPAFEIDFAKYN